MNEPFATDEDPAPPGTEASVRTTALLALWNDVEPERDAEYNEWHSVEHVPERCTVPGILWGRRYRTRRADAGPRYLTLYGLRDPQTLESEPYLRLLREPTPASRAMRPALRNISRWVCQLHEGDDPGAAAGLVVSTTPGTLRPGRAIAAFAAAFGERTLLVGERLMGATPLPWLASGQEQAQDGGWLLCAPVGEFFDHTQAITAAASIAAAATSFYVRLPVAAS
jgi:hypothetical protein